MCRELCRLQQLSSAAKHRRRHRAVAAALPHPVSCHCLLFARNAREENFGLTNSVLTVF